MEGTTAWSSARLSAPGGALTWSGGWNGEPLVWVKSLGAQSSLVFLCQCRVWSLETSKAKVALALSAAPREPREREREGDWKQERGLWAIRPLGGLCCCSAPLAAPLAAAMSTPSSQHCSLDGSDLRWITEGAGNEQHKALAKGSVESYGMPTGGGSL